MRELTITAASDLFRAEPESFVDVGPAEVAYRRVGSGPDVLFVHGWPVSGATFRTLLPHLAPHVTCHVVDLPGAGSSRYRADAPVSIDLHVESVRRVIDALGLESVAVVGHDSGGLISRHALAGDPRLRAMGLIDTEQSTGLTMMFKAFLASRHLPGFGSVFRRLLANPRLRRSEMVLGGAFADRSLLDGEFHEFFVAPLCDRPDALAASVRILRSFDRRWVDELDALHRRIEAPVQMVWGEDDPFFPVAWARAMVPSFPDARLEVIPGGRLFVHEEFPAEVAAALLPTLTGTR